MHGQDDNVVHKIANPHNLLDSGKNIVDPNKHVFVTAKGKSIPKEDSIQIHSLYSIICADVQKKLENATGSYGEYFTNE